jgi:predicted Zn finger-like uncharacterized protein
MIVGCPRCGTRYRLPERSALGPDATFECTRCEHVFAADAAAEDPDAPELEGPEPPEPVRAAPPPPSPPPPPPPEDDTPDDEFVFDDDEPEAPPKAARRTEPERGRKAARRVDEEPLRKGKAARRDDGDFDDTDDDEDASWARRGAPKPKAAKADKAAAAPARQPHGALAFAVRCMLIVTVGYAVLSVYLYTHPHKLTDALASLPIVGPTLIETQLDPGEIELIDVHGDYRRVRDGALVFAITGQAVNNSPLPVDGVQILGRIAGADTRRQVVFCGTAPRDVEDLTIREISLLQTLAPPGDWRLESGGQANFLVAFPEPSEALTEFTAEVVAVRRRRRARSADKDV